MQKVEDLLSTSKLKMNSKISKLKNLKENLLKVNNKGDSVLMNVS